MAIYVYPLNCMLYYVGHMLVLQCSFDFELTFGLSVLSMTKVERLQYGESLMTHAMVLTGVHIEVSSSHLQITVQRNSSVD